MCGFVGHNAKLGCSKCLKEFSSIGSSEDISDKRRDFSGFNQNDWPIWNLQDHRLQAYNHLNAKTKTEQKHIESNYGIRYSALLELPYWDPIQFSVVDPMHNLFLGTGKHVMQVWINRGILSKNELRKTSC